MIKKQLERYMLKPFERFFRLESSSGIILIIATVAALLMANTGLSDFYKEFWQYKIGFDAPGFELKKPLILWINDGLMAIFFFLIGLEIKREILVGELNSIRKAAFPLFGAIGGIAVPVAFYFVLNQDPDTVRGWGIPMATDIAFSLAVLSLLGRRVPLGLKVFLTAFAIVDDIGAVLVIAIFYSGTIQWMLILYSFIILSVLAFMSMRMYYNKYLHFILGAIVWLLFLKSGIHPTVAGILIAFTIPIRRKCEVKSLFAGLKDTLTKLGTGEETKKDETLLTREQIALIDNVEEMTNSVQSPLQQLEHNLHGWVAYLILPIFALANAGVVFEAGGGMDTTLAFNIAVSLLLGKGIGVTVVALLAVKFGLADLPEGVNMKQILGVGFLAGLGFTMAIFITNLAFVNEVFVNSAKMGILAGSLLAGVLGYIIIRLSSRST